MIVLLAAVVVVCAGVVVVAVGRGGQMAEFAHDTPPLGLPARRPIAGTDVALLRLPAGPVGYSFTVTDDALRRIAHAITERDTRIAVLEQQVAELRAGKKEADSPAEGDDGSPWFDRTSSFAGRPPVPALPQTKRPVSLGTGEKPAIEAKPADDEPEDDGPPTAALEPDEVDAPDDAKPAEPEPEDAKPEEPEDAKSEDAKPAGTEPEDAKPEEPAKPAEADEDWVFEDDVEPVVEPVTGRTGFSAAVPWPGDRLVASSRDDTDDDEKADPEPRGEGH